MTTGTWIKVKSEVRCKAPHPLAQSHSRFRGRHHNAFINVVPFAVRFTGRVVQFYEEIHVGFYPARCKCGKITEYEIVAPSELQAPS